jgi:PAS domain S-box-containing protein
MRQEPDKIKQSNDKPDREAHSLMNAGSELDFAYILNTVGQGVLVTGKGWRFEYVNPAFARLVGKPIEDLIGKSMDDIVIPEDLPTLAQMRSKRLAGETNTYDLRLRRSDGEVVYVHATGAPRRLGDKVIGSISIITDLTEQKKIETALKAERDKAERYLNIAEVILVALDTDARIIRLNRKGYQILGYEEGELIGKNWIKTCLRPEDHERVLTTNNKIVAGEIELFEYYENYVLTKKGEERYIAWHTTVLKDDKGRIIGTLSSGEDITDRRRAEEALKESEEKYRNLVERANDGITIIQDGTVRYANRALTKLWGGSVEEIVGRPFTDFIDRDEIPTVVERYQRRMANKNVTPIYETTLKRRDGTEIFVELNAGLITFQGSPANLVIIRDITERKLAEKAL